MEIIRMCLENNEHKKAIGWNDSPFKNASRKIADVFKILNICRIEKKISGDWRI
jgi:hypothetical protein